MYGNIRVWGSVGWSNKGGGVMVNGGEWLVNGMGWVREGLLKGGRKMGKLKIGWLESLGGGFVIEELG